MLLRDVVVKIAAGSVLVTPSKTLIEMPREKWRKSAVRIGRIWLFANQLIRKWSVSPSHHTAMEARRA